MRVCPIFDTSDVPCIQVTPNLAILFDEGGSRNKLRRYVYDHVFNDTASQEVVYQKTTAALVQDVLNGYSAAVFAYGATGSGWFMLSHKSRGKSFLTFFCYFVSFFVSFPFSRKVSEH